MTYWTTKERRTAFEMRRAGKTCADIGKHLGRSTGSVKSCFAKPSENRAERRQNRALLERGGDIGGCESLRVATITAIARHARSRSICIDVAARELLSGVAR